MNLLSKNQELYQNITRLKDKYQNDTFRLIYLKL